MIRKIRIPTLDANIEDVTLTAWLRREGDVVRKGEPLAEMTTSKASFDFESPCAGTLRKQVAPEKSVIPVGFVFALVGAASDALPDVTAENAAAVARYQAGGAGMAEAPPPAPEADAGRVRATPAARRLAREMGVDLGRAARDLKVDALSESDILRWQQEFGK